MSSSDLFLVVEQGAGIDTSLRGYSTIATYSITTYIYMPRL
jgi:hypothetical protein